MWILGKNTVSMPCLNYLVSWPALLQNMRQTLILGLESTKEQWWEVILLHVAIPAEFPEIYNEKKNKNEQAKTNGQWVQSHCCLVVDIKDLHTDPSHQGSTKWNYCTLRTLTIQAIKGDREARQSTYGPACFPEVHQGAQSPPTDTTSSSLWLQPGNPPSALRYWVKHLNNCVKNLSFRCQSRNKSTPKQLQRVSNCTFFDV